LDWLLFLDITKPPICRHIQEYKLFLPICRQEPQLMSQPIRPIKPATMTLRLAVPRDAKQISELLIANSAAKGGALYGDWSKAVVRAWITSGTPIVVAVSTRRIRGVLFSAENSDSAPPPVKAMFEVCPKNLANPYAYGPICVDSSLRGQGVPAKLYQLLAANLPGRRGVLFIDESNRASLNAHLKLGMAVVGHFSLGEQAFDVLLTP
jgi:hypothetical protein